MLAGIGERWLKKGLWCVLAGLALVAALGVGLAALYLWLTPLLPPAGALAVIAGILLLLALLAGLLAVVPRRTSVPVSTAASVADLAPEVLEALRRAVAADPRGAVLGAVAAGFIAENQPGLDGATLSRLLGQLGR